MEKWNIRKNKTAASDLRFGMANYARAVLQTAVQAH